MVNAYPFLKRVKEPGHGSHEEEDTKCRPLTQQTRSTRSTLSTLREAEMASFLYRMQVVASTSDVFAYLLDRAHTRYLDDASMFYKDYLAWMKERP